MSVIQWFNITRTIHGEGETMIQVSHVLEFIAYSDCIRRGFAIERRHTWQLKPTGAGTQDPGAEEGLGVKSALKELGLAPEMELQIDASAAEGILQRRGLGKTRHIETQELWSQEALQEGKFSLSRIDTRINTADAGTKPLGRDQLEGHLARMGYIAPSCQAKT